MAKQAGTGNRDFHIAVVLGVIAILCGFFCILSGITLDLSPGVGAKYYHQKSVSVTRDNTTMSESWVTETLEKPDKWPE